MAKAAAVPKPRGRPPKKVPDGEVNENGPSAASESEGVASKRSRAKPKAEAKVEAPAKKKPARTSKKQNQEEGSPKAKGGEVVHVEASAKAAANKKRKAADADEHPSGVPKKRESKNSSEHARERRKIRAEQALDRLKGQVANLPGLYVPGQEELGQRISFTQVDRNSFGTSVGVVLYSESFYVNKPAQPESWPSSCKWLKAPLACICECQYDYVLVKFRFLGRGSWVHFTCAPGGWKGWCDHSMVNVDSCCLAVCASSGCMEGLVLITAAWHVLTIYQLF